MLLAPTDPGLLFFLATRGAAPAAGRSATGREQIADRFPDVPALLPLCATYDPACEAFIVVLAPGAAAQVPRVQCQADGTFTVTTVNVPSAITSVAIDIIMGRTSAPSISREDNLR